jgi:hypothetical protein
MTADRKKPGVAFWTTVVVVVVLVAYLLGIGPTAWVIRQPWCPTWAFGVCTTIYSPITWLEKYGPEPIRSEIGWYGHWWY